MKTINLIRTKTAMSPQTGPVADVLRKISLWALALLVVSGVLTSGIFFYLQNRQQQLVNTKQQLLQTIAQSTTKEGLLAALKQRAALTEKILGVRQPVATVFDTLSTFTTPGQVTSVALDDHSKVFFAIHSESMTDVISLVDALLKQVAANRARAPQLVSLGFGHSGGIDVAFSFIAEF